MSTGHWLSKVGIGVVGALLLSATVGGEEQTPPPPPQQKEATESVQSQVDAERRGVVETKRKAMLEEAISAVEETKNALSALEKNSKDKALAALQKATGKLEILVSRDPKMALTPIDVDLIAHDIYSSLEAIKRAKDEAEDLLEDGKVQKARPLVKALASEIVIRTTNLPLGTYPSAIKAVAPLIDAGKVDQAKEALQQALNTLVVTENVIALPLLRAELMLEHADELAQKPSKTGAEHEEAKRLMVNARYQLVLAEALGYGETHDYQELTRLLDHVDTQLAQKKASKETFAEVHSSLSRLRRSLF
jgi:ribosomal protein S7